MDRKIEKKKFPPKKIALYAVLGAVVLAVLYGLVFGDHSRRLNVPVERITISSVEYGPFQEWIPVNGQVMPIKTHYLDAVEGGVVEEKLVEEGTLVEKGQPLVRLSNTNLLLDIMYREAELFRQINNLRNTRISMEQRRLDLQGSVLDFDYQIKAAERRYKRSKELSESNLVSDEEMQVAEEHFEYLKSRRMLTVENYKQDSLFRNVQIQNLEESVLRMESNLSVVKQKQDNLTIKAPLSGHLTSLDAEIGQSKSRGVRIGQIDVLDGFKVRVPVDEFYLARINIGQQGTFTFAGQDYQLSITKVYPEVSNGRFEVDMEFIGEEPDGIRRGQTLRIRLQLGDRKDALMLARGGFYQSTGGRWVFVVTESGDEAVKRDIQIGQMNSLMFEILDGLQQGEEVVTSSYDNFGDVEKLVLKGNK